MSTYAIEMLLGSLLSRVSLWSNEKKRFKPCVKPKDVLTEWIVTGVETIAVVGLMKSLNQVAAIPQ
jgi:hypothetical protein